MNRLWILAVVSLFSSPLAAHANPANLTPEKLKAFQDAQAALDGQFREFTRQVEICAIPSFGPRIIEGFTGPAATSAVNALGAHVKSVEKNVGEAELKLSGLGDLRAACRSGGYEATVAAADAIAKEVQAKLATDAAEYEAGQKVALQNEATVRTILNKRISMAAIAQAATIDGCKKALAMLGEEGKNNGPMRDADKALREKLSGLKDGYTDRVAGIRDFGRSLASQNACGGTQMRRAGLFPSFGGDRGREREAEFQVADIPAEAGSASAR